jgi:hypothetical protein
MCQCDVKPNQTKLNIFQCIKFRMQINSSFVTKWFRSLGLNDLFISTLWVWKTSRFEILDSFVKDIVPQAYRSLVILVWTLKYCKEGGPEGIPTTFCKTLLWVLFQISGFSLVSILPVLVSNWDMNLSLEIFFIILDPAGPPVKPTNERKQKLQQLLGYNPRISNV